MVQLCNNKFGFNESDLSHFFDDCATYSGLGLEEFKILRPTLKRKWNGLFEKLPNDISDSPYQQYGNGGHASESKRISGSIVINALSDKRHVIGVRHLIIKWSQQWIIRRNVRKCFDIKHTMVYIKEVSYISPKYPSNRSTNAIDFNVPGKGTDKMQSLFLCET